MNPMLTLFSPSGKILRTGAFAWEEVPKAITFSPEGAGVYSLLLRVDAGPWGIASTDTAIQSDDASLIVPARTVFGRLAFPGDALDITVTFDTPQAKWQAQESLSPRGYRPSPLKRVYRPQPNGKKRP